MSEIVHTTREIEALIPHRWPILMVDRIVEYDAGAKRIVGVKAITASDWWAKGHFPGLPVLPGVLQVEALAQTMAVYVAKQPGFGDRIGLFAGIDDCRFKRIVVPGDRLADRLEGHEIAVHVRQDRQSAAQRSTPSGGMMNESLASQATSPSTLATPFARPNREPSFSIVISSRMRSPGATTRLKRHSSMAAKRPIRSPKPGCLAT